MSKITFAENRHSAELAKASNTFAENRHHFDGDVILWDSNDRSPMDDMMSDWLELGLIDLAVFRATENARKEQNEAFLAERKEARNNRTPEQIAEEAFELRAAFGPDQTIVDVFTGERVVS